MEVAVLFNYVFQLLGTLEYTLAYLSLMDFIMIIHLSEG